MTLLLFAVLACLPARAEVVWRDGWAKGLAEARASGKPALVDFQAPWCYSCYFMEQRVLSRPAFAEKSAAFVPVRLDVDREEGHSLRESLHVSYLPSYLLVDAQGRELGRIVGEQTEKDFLGKLDVLLKPSPSDAGEAAAAALRQALVQGRYEPAFKEVEALPAATLKELSGRRDWKLLRARLDLMRAVESGKGDGIAALRLLLKGEPSCELAYDVYFGEKPVGALPEKDRQSVWKAEREALEHLRDHSLLVSRADRCADFRTGVEVLAGVYEKLGLKVERTLLLKRALSLLQDDKLAVGEDRNHDDDLRYFLDLAGDEAGAKAHFQALVAAYPSDYVYPLRFARYLQEHGYPDQALTWIEKADKLCYGANRLAVTKVRAKVLASLDRKEEAVALLKRDIKAGGKVFREEAKQLEDVLAEIQR